MEPVRVRKKGQITLPADLRKDLGLKDGDVIYFDRRGGHTLLVTADDIIARTAGALKKYVTDGPVEIDRDKIWAEIAEERDGRIWKQLAEEKADYDPD